MHFFHIQLGELIKQHISHILGYLLFLQCTPLLNAHNALQFKTFQCLFTVTALGSGTHGPAQRHPQSFETEDQLALYICGLNRKPEHESEIPFTVHTSQEPGTGYDAGIHVDRLSDDKHFLLQYYISPCKHQSAK